MAPKIKGKNCAFLWICSSCNKIGHTNDYQGNPRYIFAELTTGLYNIIEKIKMHNIDYFCFHLNCNFSEHEFQPKSEFSQFIYIIKTGSSGPSCRLLLLGLSHVNQMENICKEFRDVNTCTQKAQQAKNHRERHWANALEA